MPLQMMRGFNQRSDSRVNLICFAPRRMAIRSKISDLEIDLSSGSFLAFLQVSYERVTL
jgi:hypothetical protein